jgi:hypothetical protein
LTGNLTVNAHIILPQNPVGTTYGNGVVAAPTYMISQAAGDNDAIRLYSESAVTNSVSFILEVNDDIETVGNEWIFRNKKTYGDYAATTPFRISGAGAAFVNGNEVWHAGNITPVPTSRTITINGTSQDLSANRTFTVGTVTSVDLTGGTGITVSGGPITSSGSITVTNDDRGSSQNIFKNIAVAGQSDIVADTNNDTLTVAAGTGISITTNSTTDTLTITNTSASLDPKTESINIRATVPYSVTTPFDDVIIDGVNVQRNAPNTVTSTSKLLAIVTLQVENTGSTGFTGFTLRLFNQTTTTAITNTTTKWSAYMYPAASEFGFTSFTYHIPIDDTSVAVSDPIQLQLQLEVGTCDISIANFTLMSISK